MKNSKDVLEDKVDIPHTVKQKDKENVREDTRKCKNQSSNPSIRRKRKERKHGRRNHQ